MPLYTLILPPRGGPASSSPVLTSTGSSRARSGPATARPASSSQLTPFTPAPGSQDPRAASVLGRHVAGLDQPLAVHLDQFVHATTGRCNGWRSARTVGTEHRHPVGVVAGVIVVEEFEPGVCRHVTRRRGRLASRGTLRTAGPAVGDRAVPAPAATGGRRS